jgi:2',3'-cyclic-nucleotide 2'-phosphodiesterase (5'-nucleotidase family)
MRSLRRLLTICALLCVLPASAMGAVEPARTVTILFTNDFESAYDPVEAFWRDDVARIGGVAELAGLVASIRAREAPVFLFDAGDIFTGTLARRTRGAVSFDLMQLMGYDAMAVGNHEFEYGWEAFAREKARAPFPVLGANLFYAGTDHPYAQPWTIVERDGVRLGVVGLLGRDAATALIPANIAGVDVRDPVETLRPLVARLREEVDLVVVLVHQGPTAPMQTDDEADPRVHRGNRENLALAGAVPGIDLILAGHTDAGTPTALVHPDTGTLLMQTWGQGQHLGVLRLILDEAGAVAAHDSALLAVDADLVVADAAVAERLAAWRARHPDLREVLGQSVAVLARRYYDEAPLGNLFADLVRTAADAEIGLMPSGALRRDLPAGAVRRVDLLDAFPFEDRVARVALDGATLRAVLEQGFSLERGLLQVSGLRVLHDPDAPAGARVRAVCVNGMPLDPRRRYLVGTLEILAAGGDAYVQFHDAEAVEYLPERYAEVLEAALTAGEALPRPATDRIVADAADYACGA